jgi:hypothetical protein
MMRQVDSEKQKLIKKLGNAAKKSFTREALDRDHIQFLAQKNNEARTRRATKSAILSMARVATLKISWKNGQSVLRKKLSK